MVEAEGSPVGAEAVEGVEAGRCLPSLYVTGLDNVLLVRAFSRLAVNVARLDHVFTRQDRLVDYEYI